MAYAGRDEYVPQGFSSTLRSHAVSVCIPSVHMAAGHCPDSSPFVHASRCIVSRLSKTSLSFCIFQHPSWIAIPEATQGDRVSRPVQSHGSLPWPRRVFGCHFQAR